MTGPEHYVEAEAIIRDAIDVYPKSKDSAAQKTADFAATLALAQVHATLALAASVSFYVERMAHPLLTVESPA